MRKDFNLAEFDDPNSAHAEVQVELALRERSKGKSHAILVAVRILWSKREERGKRRRYRGTRSEHSRDMNRRLNTIPKVV